MANSNASEELAYGIIRQALWNNWDPIGVRTFSEPKDEYDAYVPVIYNLLKSGASQAEIFDYLWTLETRHMGLEGDMRNTYEFSKLLVSILDNLET